MSQNNTSCKHWATCLPCVWVCLPHQLSCSLIRKIKLYLFSWTSLPRRGTFSESKSSYQTSLYHTWHLFWI